tara:strand:- start:228 stop:356 length:129 start_codon:yes stop_codon:yes gene_type:complete
VRKKEKERETKRHFFKTPKSKNVRVSPFLFFLFFKIQQVLFW